MKPKTKTQAQAQAQAPEVEVGSKEQAENTTAGLFHGVKMKLSQRTKASPGNPAKNIFKKFLTYGLPTLDQVSTALPAPDSWEHVDHTEDGETATISTPVYSDPVMAYMQEALSQRIQGLARSRDSASQDPCTSWAEVAESGGGGSKYPAQLKAFKDGFAAWLLSDATPYAQVQVAAIISYMDLKWLIKQDEQKKAKFAAEVSKYVDHLGDEAADFGSVIGAINKAITTEIEALDW